MKHLPAFVLFLLTVNSSFSQQKQFTYKPEHADSVHNYVAAATARKASGFTGKYQKEIHKILDERKESFLKNIADSTYIFDRRINVYLKSVLREIYTSNKDIRSDDYYFFIDKSPVPNAACYGNGIFTVNLGLLELLDNEDELAFVLCHEIAHMTLKHNDSSLVQHVATMNSRTTRKKINNAAATRYGRRQALTAVIKDLSYNFQRRSCDAEMQADSIGYVYYSKTRYDKAAAARALKKLDLSDSLLFTADSNLRKHFNFEAYPFKEVWLERDQTLFDLDETANDLALDKDSIKTHPDIPLRIKRLHYKIGNNFSDHKIAEQSTVKKIAAENSIAISMDHQKIDLALYLILTASERDEIDTKNYCNNVAYLLKRTYDLKSGHNFGKYVNPVSPFSDEKYLNDVRQFLHNIELKNIRKIGYQFCKKYENEMKGDAEFASINSFFTNLNL